MIRALVLSADDPAVFKALMLRAADMLLTFTVMQHVPDRPDYLLAVRQPDVDTGDVNDVAESERWSQYVGLLQASDLVHWIEAEFSRDGARVLRRANMEDETATEALAAMQAALPVREYLREIVRQAVESIGAILPKGVTLYVVVDDNQEKSELLWASTAKPRQAPREQIKTVLGKLARQLDATANVH